MLAALRDCETVGSLRCFVETLCTCVSMCVCLCLPAPISSLRYGRLCEGSVGLTRSEGFGNKAEQREWAGPGRAAGAVLGGGRARLSGGARQCRAGGIVPCRWDHAVLHRYRGYGQPVVRGHRRLRVPEPGGHCGLQREAPPGQTLLQRLRARRGECPHSPGSAGSARPAAVELRVGIGAGGPGFGALYRSIAALSDSWKSARLCRRRAGLLLGCQRGCSGSPRRVHCAGLRPSSSHLLYSEYPFGRVFICLLSDFKIIDSDFLFF